MYGSRTDSNFLLRWTNHLSFGARTRSGIQWTPITSGLQGAKKFVTDNDVLAFAATSIKSVWALELLFLLRRGHERAWGTAELVRELRSSDVVVSEALSSLQSAGLVAEAADKLYRYQPRTPELDKFAAATERLYAAKPMAITKAIMSAPNDKLRIFSDAFKFKE